MTYALLVYRCKGCCFLTDKISSLVLDGSGEKVLLDSTIWPRGQIRVNVKGRVPQSPWCNLRRNTEFEYQCSRVVDYILLVIPFTEGVKKTLMEDHQETKSKRERKRIRNLVAKNARKWGYSHKGVKDYNRKPKYPMDFGSWHSFFCRDAGFFVVTRPFYMGFGGKALRKSAKKHRNLIILDYFNIRILEYSNILQKIKCCFFTTVQKVVLFFCNKVIHKLRSKKVIHKYPVGH